VTTVLAAFGIDADSEQLYRQVLRRGTDTVAEHAAALDWEPARVQAALAPLREHRLVRHNLDDTITAPHPRRTLTRLIERESLHLDLRRRELEDVVAAVGDYSAEHRSGRAQSLTPAAEGSSALEAVPADSVPTLVEDLLGTTSGPIRSFHLSVGSGPATDSGVVERARQALAAGRELRSIYPVSVLDDPQHLAWVREWAALGEGQRVVESVRAEFAVLGEDAVISAPMWGSPVSSALVTRVPLLVAAFTAVFDESWTGGLPVPDEGSEQDADTRLLALLASGFKDEAIARYLGLSLRTVRRRVASLMDDLSVHTRFQLGVVAERRGLLGRRS
jgi:DNA-binding NarL/FixJ family response regulator